MNLKFTPEGLINIELTYDELIMLMIVITNNISQSSILEKPDQEKPE